MLYILDLNEYRDIIINNLRLLIENKRIKLYAFLIMVDHIHLIWQTNAAIDTPTHAQRDFLKYTAQQIKHDFQKNYPEHAVFYMSNR
ncbi:MAG TPA: hypothetical protein VF487_06400 [Chitinophagaceae bacterium]